MTLALLWQITLGSWITAALILLARLLFGRWLTPRGRYLLWLPLLLRLLLPFTPPSPTSMLNVVPDGVMGEAVLLEDTQSAPAAEPGEAEPAPAPVGRYTGNGLRDWALRIWLTGLGAVLLIQVLLYRLGAKALDRLPLCTDAETRSELLRLRQLTGIDGSLRLAWGSAGMLGGLLRPTMVLPVDRRKEAAAPILLHELMHQKFRHLWLGLLLRLLTAVYWFNPALWLCLPLMRQDCEELCDQLALDTGLVGAREYTAVLYAEGLMNGPRSPLPRTSFGGRRDSLRRRIGQIARRRDREYRLLPLLLVLCILLCGTTAPLAKGAQPVEVNPIPPGYGTMEAYLEALQPELGRFGANFRQLEAEGYLAPSEGEWIERTERRSAFSLRRELYGAERELIFYFSPHPYDPEGEPVLCAIAVCLTEEERELDFWSDLGSRILGDWEALGALNLYRGSIVSPVEMGMVLEEPLCRRAAETAWLRDLTDDPEEYLRLLRAETPASLGFTWEQYAWVLHGCGLALYETAPGNE